MATLCSLYTTSISPPIGGREFGCPIPHTYDVGISGGFRLNLLDNALYMATVGHRGQIDKSGKPYILHPIAVGLALEKDGYIDEVVAAGFLHDVVEDTSITLKDLLDCGIHLMTVTAVNYLTRRKDDETYAQYKERCFQNEIAKVVKYYDSKHNLTRSEGVTDIDFLNFVAKRYGKTIKDFEDSLAADPHQFDHLKRPLTIENTEIYD